MLEILVALLSIFGAGFGAGYGVREMISRRRRRSYRRSMAWGGNQTRPDLARGKVLRPQRGRTAFL